MMGPTSFFFTFLKGC